MQSLKLGEGMKIKFISFLDKNLLIFLTLSRMVKIFTFLHILLLLLHSCIVLYCNVETLTVVGLCSERVR